MYYIHKCNNVRFKFMYSRSSLTRISALGVDGGEAVLLLDALRRYSSSFLVYKTKVIFILSGHRFHFNILSSIMPEMGMRIRIIEK